MQRKPSLVDPNQTCPNTHAIDNVGIDCYALGDVDASFSTKAKQVVYRRNFASDLGVSGDFPNYPQSLGFSKRRDGADSDYVYWSNLPATHFTVSSNFWGTGGTLWYAVENGNDLKLHFLRILIIRHQVCRRAASLMPVIVYL